MNTLYQPWAMVDSSTKHAVTELVRSSHTSHVQYTNDSSLPPSLCLRFGLPLHLQALFRPTNMHVPLDALSSDCTFTWRQRMLTAYTTILDCGWVVLEWWFMDWHTGGRCRIHGQRQKDEGLCSRGVTDLAGISLWTQRTALAGLMVGG